MKYRKKSAGYHRYSYRSLYLLLGQTFLEKGSSPDPFPKTSNFVFSARGTPYKQNSSVFSFKGYPLQKKRS